MSCIFVDMFVLPIYLSAADTEKQGQQQNANHRGTDIANPVDFHIFLFNILYFYNNYHKRDFRLKYLTEEQIFRTMNGLVHE